MCSKVRCEQCHKWRIVDKDAFNDCPCGESKIDRVAVGNTKFWKDAPPDADIDDPDYF